MSSEGLLAFPSLETLRALPASEDILGASDALSVPNLVRAYERGIFPWPTFWKGRWYTLWHCPAERAVWDLKDPPVSMRLRRYARNSSWHFTWDKAFRAVIEACATVSRSSDGDPTNGDDVAQLSWITPAMKTAYAALHDAGYAHSLEVWSDASQTKLIGGLYGVAVRGVFSAESMFHRESNASKLALLHLASTFLSRGLDWIDIQTSSPHMTALGAKTITRRAYLDLLESQQKKRQPLFSEPATALIET